MKNRLNGVGLLILAFLSACQPSVRSNYYFDPETGNNENAGTSPSEAFKNLDKIKDLFLKPGDSLLLKSGAVFTDHLYLSCKGSPELPVVLGKYGGEERPHIKGDASLKQAVHIYNSEYIVVRDLEISNKGKKPVSGIRGICIEADNYGEARNIIVDNLFIHDVGGLVEIEKGGGIALSFLNSRDEDTIPSCFVNLLVQNCYIKDCERDAIRMAGQWLRNKWFPSKGVVIRNNRIECVPGDGIVVVGCDSALVEYNVVRNFPETLPPSEACDGIWPWSSDHTLVQYNVVSDHHSIVDGYAYDSDWNCRNSTFQYNLSYNNIGGFMLVIATNGWPDAMCVNGNENTQIKYNISINDGLRNYKTENRFFSPIIHLTGLTKNTTIEKNLFYIYPKPDSCIDNTILHFSNHDDKYGEGDIFRNNAIFTAEPAVYAKEEKSANNVYSSNLYVGPLKVPATGFVKYNGKFDKSMWYDEKDENWNKLIEFVKDKTVPIDGTEIPILNIIGFN